MTIKLIWTIIALIIAILLSIWLYRGARYDKPKTRYFLVILRSISLFAVMLLLINPEISQDVVRYEKPALKVLIDQSESITDSMAVKSLMSQWKNDADLTQRFDVYLQGFGQELLLGDQTYFDQTETNIGGALAQMEAIHIDDFGPIILISDGLQTYGPAYQYSQLPMQSPIYPVLVGDTIAPIDLSIERIYTNHYARLGQKFPVEILLDYSGSDEPQNVLLKITQDNQVIWQQKISFSKQIRSQLLNAELPANQLGQSIYSVVLSSVSGEENLTNNEAVFGIDIIEETDNIVLVSSIKHPDLGALKRALTSNNRVDVTIASPEDAMEDTSAPDLYVLYQPDRRFAPLIEAIQAQNRNMWLVTGSETDWSFLNRSQPVFYKDQLGVVDEVTVTASESFDLFDASWLRWSELPPLKTDIGSVSVSGPHTDLLKANIQGNPLDQPIMTFYEDGNRRWILLDGSGFWSWRREAYRLERSYELFDAFVGSAAKYLAVDRSNERLIVERQPVYQRSSGARLVAQYFDAAYEPSTSAVLELSLKAFDSDRYQTRPMTPMGQKYMAALDDLSAGDYDYRVLVPGTEIQKSGKFSILSINRESNSGFAEWPNMAYLAAQNHGQPYMLDQVQDLLSHLKHSEQFVQKEVIETKTTPLIQWYYALVLLILSSAIEWWLRKYNGYT
jgi:hypothetical protein